jgi:hypothetical protein
LRRIALLALVIGFLTPFLAAAPAHAQATRTWVSGVGDDANPCSRTAPCKTFAGAISKTAASGEINVLDPGGFGGVTITKSISIRSDHIEAGVLVSGTNGIIVNVPSTSDRVLLEGLDIEGIGTGINGVQIVGSGTTTIVRCAIRHFSGNGVNLVGTSGARAVVIDSIITNNAGGFNIAGAGGVQNTGVALRNVFDNNPSFGLQTTGASNLIISANKIFGAAASFIGPNVTSFGDNAFNGTGPIATTITLK